MIHVHQLTQVSLRQSVNRERIQFQEIWVLTQHLNSTATVVTRNNVALYIYVQKIGQTTCRS